MEERKKEKKENSTELQKPNVEAEVYNNKIWDWGKKKKLKSFIRFQSANKIDNYNRGREKKGEKIQKNLQNKSKRTNSKCFSWITAIRVLSLAWVTVHLTTLGCPPTLCWSLTCCGAALILIWSYSCVFLPPMSIAIRTSAFSFVGALNDLLYISIDRVYLVNHKDLICSLYSRWEGFGSSSLATLPLGSNCGFISTSAYGLSTGVWSWGFPGGLGFAPVTARCGGGTAAWVSGVLAAPATQGSWQLGKQEIKCSKRV